MRTRTVPEVIDMAKHGLKAGLGAAKKPNFVPTGKRSNTAIKSDATARHEVPARPPPADAFQGSPTHGLCVWQSSTGT